jgi:hypothetical protein
MKINYKRLLIVVGIILSLYGVIWYFYATTIRVGSKVSYPRGTEPATVISEPRILPTTDGKTHYYVDIRMSNGAIMTIETKYLVIQ